MHVHLLGQVSVSTPSYSHGFTRPQAALVFARLVLERDRGTRRDQLAHTVWEDELPSTWGSALRNLLSGVRRVVARAGHGDIEAVDGRYLLLLDQELTVDVEQIFHLTDQAEQSLSEGRHQDTFDQAIAAIGLGQEPFLPYCGAEWAHGVRAEIDAALLRCLEHGCSAAIALGNSAGAERLARQAISSRPHLESAHRLLMVAQSQQGNRAEALTTYALLRRTLADDLGVDPSAETEQLYLSLLGADGTSSSAGDSASMPFVGRSKVQDAVYEAWQALDQTGMRVVHITGEAGVGKTQTMIESVRKICADGGQVLYGRTSQSNDRPYHAALMALGGFLTSVPEEETLRFHKTTARIVEKLLANESAVGQAESAAIEIALADTYAAIASVRPIVLLIDDVGRNGDRSLALLSRLIRDPRREFRCLVVTTADLSTRRDETVRSLETLGALAEHCLEGLTNSEIAELLELYQDLDGLTPRQLRSRAQQLQETTAGTPYLIREMLRYRPNTGLPPSIIDYLDRRLGELDGDERLMIDIGSVLRVPFSLATLASLAGVEASTAAALVDRLIAKRLIERVSSTSDEVLYRVRHGSMVTHVYSVMADADRTRLHHLSADNLERRRRTDSYVVASSITDHRLMGSHPASGHDERTVTALWHAASLAPPDEAVELCQLACTSATDGTRRLRASAQMELGRAMYAAQQPGHQQSLLTGAVDALVDDDLALAMSAIVDLELIEGDPYCTVRNDVLEHIVAVIRRRGSARLTSLNDARVVAQAVQSGLCVDNEIVRLASTRILSHLNSLHHPLQIAESSRVCAELTALAVQLDDRQLVGTAFHHTATAGALRADDEVFDQPDALRHILSYHPTEAEEMIRSDWAAMQCVKHGLAIETSDLQPSRREVGFATSSELLTTWLHGQSADLLDAPQVEALDDPSNRALRALLEGDTVGARFWACILVAKLESDVLSVQGLHQLGVASSVVGTLGDPDLASRLISLLQPVASLDCCAGYQSFVGPASYHLGRLNHVLGNFNTAEAYLNRTIRRLSKRRLYLWAKAAMETMAEVLGDRNRVTDSPWEQLLRDEISVLDDGPHRHVHVAEVLHDDDYNSSTSKRQMEGVL